MFIRNLIILANMCAEDVDNIDMNLLHQMIEFGYVDSKGKLTKYGKKILDEFLETLTL